MFLHYGLPVLCALVVISCVYQAVVFVFLGVGQGDGTGESLFR